jgi:prepilin-type N-terminal cleavage/methylation domain-containing protein
MDRDLERKHCEQVSDDQGFTLVELLVVLSILTILMSLGAFALVSYWRAQALTSASEQVITDIRDVQVRAQAEVRPYRLVFDLPNDSYQVERLGTETDPNAWDPVETRLFDSRMIDFTSSSFSAFTGCFDGHLDDELYFCARGVSSGGTLVIHSVALDQDRVITVTGLTASAEVN